MRAVGVRVDTPCHMGFFISKKQRMRIDTCPCGAGLVPVVSVGSAGAQLRLRECLKQGPEDKSESPQLCNCARDLWYK